MIIIGELINCTRKAIAEAVRERDSETIRDIVRRQAEAGAHYIDINGGIVGEEAECMKWLVEQAQEVTPLPLSIDTPLPQALESGLSAYRGSEKPIVNSITDEKEKFAQTIPLIKKYKAKVIALCIDDGGMPQSLDDRLRIAVSLFNRLTRKGVAGEDIYIDPCIFPVSVDNKNGTMALDSIAEIKKNIPEAGTVCGLSNVSYGLPARKLLNQTFLVMAMTRGLDAAILDPLDERLMAGLIAAEALRGSDEYCMNYIQAQRDGKLQP
jgi:cobalamin-dependent methionine synthase I